MLLYEYINTVIERVKLNLKIHSKIPFFLLILEQIHYRFRIN
jgi:hypothetical protein